VWDANARHKWGVDRRKKRVGRGRKEHTTQGGGGDKRRRLGTPWEQKGATPALFPEQIGPAREPWYRKKVAGHTQGVAPDKGPVETRGITERWCRNHPRDLAKEHKGHRGKPGEMRKSSARNAPRAQFPRRTKGTPCREPLELEKIQPRNHPRELPRRTNGTLGGSLE